jgi:YVTN family beta-propeller protein
VAVTDDRGEYRLTPLPIGTYTVIYELAGFQTLRREGVQLTVGFTAKADQVMNPGAVAETITVSGASPLVDVTSAATTTNLSQTALDDLPTTRDGLKAFMGLVPGMRPNLDVGASGLSDGAVFRVYGQTGEPWHMLEGVMASAPTASGANLPAPIAARRGSPIDRVASDVAARRHVRVLKTDSSELARIGRSAKQVSKENDAGESVDGLVRKETRMTSEKMFVRRALLLAAFASFPVAGAAQTPALLVVHQGENTLSIVDPSTRKVTGRVPTVDHGHSVAVSGDGKTAYVVNFAEGGRPGNSISVVDLAAKKEVRRIDLGPLTSPHGMFVAGGKVYFTAQGSKAIGRYDPVTNKVDLALGTGQNGTHNLVVSKDLNHIFTANMGSGSITAFERVTGKTVTNNAGDWNITVIPVGPAPQAIDMSPDGTEVWTGHGGDGGVSIIDVATNKLKQTIKLPYQGYNHLQFTPDGRRVILSHPKGGELVVLDAAGRKEIKRIKVGSSVTKFLIQPDGSRVYAAVNADSNVAVVDLKTLEVTGRISSGNDPDGMAWVGTK